MRICESNKFLAAEVKEFIENVRDVKEESITDYLMWKWKKIDKRFNYISASSFNRVEENSFSGADFDLELWVVGKNTHVSFAVQAKKFIKLHDSYVRKLRYPDNTKGQLDLLMSYSKSEGKIPLYFIYAISKFGICSSCKGNSKDCAVFFSHAREMEKFADGAYGDRISREYILSKCRPLYCLFCCMQGISPGAQSSFFLNEKTEKYERNNTSLPQYVRNLLVGDEKLESNDSIVFKAKNDWSEFKAVGVYDLRSIT